MNLLGLWLKSCDELFGALRISILEGILKSQSFAVDTRPEKSRKSEPRHSAPVMETLAPLRFEKPSKTLRTTSPL